MAITSAIKDVKIVLKLAEGSQTISNCNPAASDQSLYDLGTAVAKLEAQRTDAITKVVETSLISE